MNLELVMAVLGAVSVCLSALLCLFLLLVPGPLRRANRLFAGFLLLTAIDLAGWTMHLFPPAAFPFFAFRLPLAYLQMPLLYGYVGLLCFPAWRSRANRIAAALAVALSILSLLPRMAAVVGLGGAEPAGDIDLLANNVALHVQFYLYLALMARLLIRYRQAEDAAADGSRSLVIPWVGALLAVSLLAHALVVAKSWAAIGGHEGAHVVLEIVVGMVAVGISCALALTAMLRQSLFVGRQLPLAPKRNPPQPVDPAALATLERHMAEQRPFLDPALTIRTLARRIGMGQRELSALINQHFGMHFFDYVNGHRIDMAAALLAEDRDATVLDIAHQVGFNTKSSFNAAFSKHRGETPTQFRARVGERR